jgi:hypothetical protein
LKLKLRTYLPPGFEKNLRLLLYAYKHRQDLTSNQSMVKQGGKLQWGTDPERSGLEPKFLTKVFKKSCLVSAGVVDELLLDLNDVLQLKRPNLPHFSPLFVCLYILPENSGYGNYLANNYLYYCYY